MKLIINPNKCPQDHPCPAISVCPKSAITQQNASSLPKIDEALCIVCGKCIRFCPKGAFEKES